MYSPDGSIGLTVTLDVFKYFHPKEFVDINSRLTVTLDVFKLTKL